MSNKKHILISYPIILFCLLVDQITKLLLTNQYFEIVPKLLSVYYTENSGAAWSLMSGRVILLVILSICFLSILVLFSYKFKEKNVFYSLSYAFIIGGALGNLIDRVVFLYVRDFIKLDFVNFPIFNFADSFLVIGVIMFCVFVFFIYPKIEVEITEKEPIKITETEASQVTHEKVIDKKTSANKQKNKKKK